MELSQLADFHAVAMHGGFSAASRASRTPKGTLARRIKALESDLGVRLFERGPRSIRLTEEGEALRARTAPLLADLAEAGDEIAGRAGRPRGRLRVSVPGYFAQQGFGAFAARFAAAYPEVVLDVSVDDRFVDPIVEGMDLVIRVNPAPDSLLVGRRLSRNDFLVVARPGVPRPSTSGVSVPAVVLTSRPRGETWTFDDAGTQTTVKPTAVLRLASMLLVRDAVLAGAGAGLIAENIARPDIAAGRLQSWGRLLGRNVEIWVLHPSKRQPGAKIDAMMAMLVDTFTQ